MASIMKPSSRAWRMKASRVTAAETVTPLLARRAPAFRHQADLLIIANRGTFTSARRASSPIEKPLSVSHLIVGESKHSVNYVTRSGRKAAGLAGLRLQTGNQYKWLEAHLCGWADHKNTPD